MFHLQNTQLKRSLNVFIASMFLALQLPLGLLGVSTVAAANEGTLKVHEYGSTVEDPSNEPKVCNFNFEGFGFDPNQAGQLSIEPQGKDSGTTDSATLAFAAGPDGYAETTYINSTTQTLDNGHYKVTLYGKDTQGNYSIDLKAKSKVFKVECAAAPTAVANLVPCVAGSGANSTVTVTVTNTADSTGGTVTYSVSLGGQTQPITLADGTSGTVTFTGLAVGPYSAVVTGSDGTVTTNSVTVVNCPVVTPDKGSITIVKDAQPNSTQDFEFSGVLDNGLRGGSFTLDDDAGVAGADNTYANSLLHDNLNAGVNVFTESAVDGWELDQITCSEGANAVVDLANRKVTITLAQGQNVTCTFVNKVVPVQPETGSITIIKDAQPNSSEAFAFTGNLGNFTLTDDGVHTAEAHKTVSDLTEGTYTVTEPAVQGWTLASITCQGGSDAKQNNRNAVIKLKAGEDVTCTFVNTKDVTPPVVITPNQPSVTVTVLPCVLKSLTNDTVSVRVTNTADDTHAAVTYTVNFAGQTKTITLADGASDTVTFADLATGSYNATISGNDGTSATSNTVTISDCPDSGDVLGETIVATTGGMGGGSVLGATFTATPASPVLATTGANMLGSLFAGLMIIGLAGSLAITRRRTTSYQ